MTIKRVPVAVAAAVMGKSLQFVRRGLIAGKLPFGVAVKGDGRKYSYHISPKLFMAYTGCPPEELSARIRGD